MRFLHHTLLLIKHHSKASKGTASIRIVIIRILLHRGVHAATVRHASSHHAVRHAVGAHAGAGRISWHTVLHAAVRLLLLLLLLPLLLLFALSLDVGEEVEGVGHRDRLDEVCENR